MPVIFRLPLEMKALKMDLSPSLKSNKETECCDQAINCPYVFGLPLVKAM
jgi:hypothetical protein